MKNLPCYLVLATFASLVLLVAVASCGVRLPVFDIASHIIGYAAAATVLAVAITDKAPRPLDATTDAAAVKTTAEPASARPRRAARWDERPAIESLAEDALATLNMHNDPATVSIM
ncbi:MAG TPA: hypothetical protein VHD61_14835 [Lacunisphaera sp.]|nr:hypothetical protein [Lacunisphaera sp.]